MTLKEFFSTEQIDLDFIEDNFDGEYWESCQLFISHNWDRDIEKLSTKQLNWAHKILEDCTEKRCMIGREVTCKPYVSYVIRKKLRDLIPQ